MPTITVDVNRLDYAVGFWRTSFRHPVNETLMKWGGVRSVHRTRGYFYIRVTRSTGHIIPRRFSLRRVLTMSFGKRCNA